ncbi:MAG: hypothetical protein IKZ30_01335 [Oscillospiraceae bacterium]|nr:hypothetical protein [Oscillospiraceae bacterium]
MAEDGFAMGYALGQDSGGSNGGGGFGNWGDGIWAVIILAILFGGGNLGGFGGFGGNGGGNMSAGFAWQGIDGGIRGVQQGICDATFSLNNTIVNGFRGVDSAICSLGYQNQQCCCETQRLIERGFCDTQHAICNSTRDIIDNQNCNYRSLMDFLVQSKIDKLRDENDALRLQISQANQNAYFAANQEAQTAELIRRLGRSDPVPSYLVPNPNCCYGNPVSFSGWGNGFGGNSGCGCGC